jgi:hypothetical protein
MHYFLPAPSMSVHLPLNSSFANTAAPSLAETKLFYVEKHRFHIFLVEHASNFGKQALPRPVPRYFHPKSRDLHGLVDEKNFDKGVPLCISEF